MIQNRYFLKVTPRFSMFIGKKSPGDSFLEFWLKCDELDGYRENKAAGHGEEEG